jgi:hypothetical protein
VRCSAVWWFEHGYDLIAKLETKRAGGDEHHAMRGGNLEAELGAASQLKLRKGARAWIVACVRKKKV